MSSGEGDSTSKVMRRQETSTIMNENYKMDCKEEIIIENESNMERKESLHDDIKSMATEDLDDCGLVDIDAFIEAIASEGVGSENASDIFNKLETPSPRPIIESSNLKSIDPMRSENVVKCFTNNRKRTQTETKGFDSELTDDCTKIDIDSFVEEMASDIFGGFETPSTIKPVTEQSELELIDVVGTLSILNDLKSVLGALGFAIPLILEKAKEKEASKLDPLKCFTPEDTMLLELMLNKLMRDDTEKITNLSALEVNQGICRLEKLLTVLKDPNHWMFHVRAWASASEGMSKDVALDFLSLEMKAVNCPETLHNVYSTIQEINKARARRLM